MEMNFHFIYKRLFEFYGPQGWWPADSDFNMMMGAILVQNTNWKNVEKAMANLGNYLHPEILRRLKEEELAQLIQPSGYYNRKAKKIKAFLEWYEQYDYRVDDLKQREKEVLRRELLDIHGIGNETADVILLYALEKPVFVADNYARRTFGRLGYEVPKSYDGFRKMAEENLPEDVALFNEYHALLVEHGKRHCKASPICTGCPLLDICEQRI